jgi:hypothetical protein
MASQTSIRFSVATIAAAVLLFATGPIVSNSAFAAGGDHYYHNFHPHFYYQPCYYHPYYYHNFHHFYYQPCYYHPYYYHNFHH